MTLQLYAKVSLALLISSALCACSMVRTGPRWVTYENNLGDGIVDKNLRTVGMTSSSPEGSSMSFERWTLKELQEAGYLQTSDTLLRYLQANDFSCAASAASKYTCRLDRYKVEARQDGGPDDGFSRIEWKVVASWDSGQSPLKPSFHFTRSIEALPPRR